MNAALVQTCMNEECYEIAVQVVDYGCVHEHIATDVYTCHACWVELMYLIARENFVCTPCLEAGHWCPLRIIRDESLGLHKSSGDQHESSI